MGGRGRAHTAAAPVRTGSLARARPGARARAPAPETRAAPGAPAAVAPRARAWRLHRGDPRGRGRRSGVERRQPHDRRRHLAGRVRRGEHRHPAAPDERRARQDPHRPRADGRPRFRRRSRPRPPRGGGGVRPGQARASRLGHGLRDRGRRRRHGLRRRTGRRPDREGARRPDGWHRHDAVQVRRHEASQPGDRRRRHPALELRHGHRRPEREAARGARPRDVDARRVPHRRRRPAPGRPGHLRPDHAARTDQPRLRRRAHDHEGRRYRADGNRLLRERREPRPRCSRAGVALAADRDRHRRRQRASCSRSPAATTSRSTR